MLSTIQKIVSNKRMFVEHFNTSGKNLPGTGQKCSKTRTIIYVQKLNPHDGFLNTPSRSEHHMKIGYARVSTDDQHLELQLDALRQAGFEKIFEDKMSGSKFDRPGLNEALAYAHRDDVLVVWRLDRLGRSLPDLLDLVTKLETSGIGLHSLGEQICTDSPSGKLIFHIFAALSEFERNLIRERTMAGLKAARSRGRKGGRRAKLDEKQIRLIRAALRDPNVSVSEVAEEYGVSRGTIYKYATMSKLVG